MQTSLCHFSTGKLASLLSVTILTICQSARTVNSPEYTVKTPNCLLLGCNKYRSITGPLLLDCTPTQILDRIQSTGYSLQMIIQTNAFNHSKI